jgi:hypothetical protein
MYIYLLFWQDIGTELKVKDLETVIPRIQRVTKELEEVHKYEQVSKIYIGYFFNCLVLAMLCIDVKLMIKVSIKRN